MQADNKSACKKITKILFNNCLLIKKYKKYKFDIRRVETFSRCCKRNIR